MIDVIHGQSRLGREQRATITTAVNSVGISGTLYFGYPVLTTAEARQPLDALFVSQECGVVGILVASSIPTNQTEWAALTREQDGLFSALETHLGRHPSLRIKRKLGVPLNAVTILPDGSWQNPSPGDALLVNIATFVQELKKFEGISDADLFRRTKSVVEHVASIKPAKRRDTVRQPNSRGAKLKRIEQEIANLDHWQKQAAIATPDGPQRIRGLAGSGKTVVLALKAAYLHAQHPEWRIAVVFYSQALYQQFQDLIRRFCFEHLQDEPDWTRIRILHAWGSSYREGFYSTIAESVKLDARSWASALAQFGRETAFDGSCNELLANMPPVPSDELFNAVLIDEAQDLPISFFRLVYRSTCTAHRIVWAYDELQQLSAASMPNAKDLFGVDNNGLPLISLEEVKGEAQRDVVLPVCYRNPPWTLTVAHGLGFGTGHAGTLVQHFDDPTLWDEVGYECSKGELKLGTDVVLRRRAESYPAFFERELTAEDAVSMHVFETDADQINWVISSIRTQLEQDELEPDDFLLILPDEYTGKSRGARIVSAFAKAGMRAHNAGVHTDRDTVFQSGSIAVAHIYRAKGNEAPFVYVLDAEYASSSYGTSVLGLASRRNKLFTAITRSRAWVRICGVTPGAIEIADEIQKIKTDGYQLKFTIPTDLRSLRRLHRDRTEVEQAKLKRQRGTVEELADAYSRGEISPAEFAGLSRQQKEALRKLLGMDER